ncbi:hypothetical protein STRIP9103_07517 [Streptomyces ipomoeae 91-03]|uniref:Uncharacterized protein n=1 Tax=Streptomyces ipomoeae 91-03 TaxID=698759 RepID=L1L698_9ACTN|nr:hypothetical protein STRIP9103_07517 [Streptomyces ipomoeae 91-03]
MAPPRGLHAAVRSLSSQRDPSRRTPPRHGFAHPRPLFLAPPPMRGVACRCRLDVRH